MEPDEKHQKKHSIQSKKKKYFLSESVHLKKIWYHKKQLNRKPPFLKLFKNVIEQRNYENTY